MANAFQPIRSRRDFDRRATRPRKPKGCRGGRYGKNRTSPEGREDNSFRRLRDERLREQGRSMARRVASSHTRVQTARVVYAAAVFLSTIRAPDRLIAPVFSKLASVR